MAANQHIDRFEAALTHNTTDAELWLCAQNFIRFVVLHSRSHSKKDGSVSMGNRQKMQQLMELGLSYDDICQELLCRLMHKMHRVLQQAPEKRVSYCYVICNNALVDLYRRLPPKDMQIVHLQSKLGKGDDARTLEDVLCDPTTPEDTVLAKETAAQALAQARERLSLALCTLSDDAAQALCFLCMEQLHMKPAKIAKLLCQCGVKETFHRALAHAAASVGMQAQTLFPYDIDALDAEKSLKMESADSKVISAQISRLRYRAQKRLKL